MKIFINSSLVSMFTLLLNVIIQLLTSL